MSDAPQRTPLYDLHVELGGKIIDFAGWEMPVQFPMGIMGEHKHCREKAALFDVSHMGQVILRGDDIGAKLEAICPQAFTGLKDGKARYGFFTNADGGIMDEKIRSRLDRLRERVDGAARSAAQTGRGPRIYRFRSCRLGRFK